MTVPDRYRGVKGDECQCGRRSTIRHCIVCGSSRVYARVNRLHTLADGSKKFVETQFRCQACGHLFIEEEREFCDAPPVSAALARQKLKALHEAKQQGEYLRPNDSKIANLLEKLILPESQQDESKARKDLIYRLQVEYVDARASLAESLGLPANKLAESGQDMKETMEEYVQRRLDELGAPNREIAPIVEPETEPPPRMLGKLTDESASPEQMSVAEQSFRRTWAEAKLNGRPFPYSVEEYVERRKRGEIIHV